MEVKKLVNVAQYKIECDVDEYPEAVKMLLDVCKEDDEVPHCITFSFPEVDGNWYIVLSC